MMKILFLYPNYAHSGGDQPVGIASLSAVLKQNGFCFDFYDTSFQLMDPSLEDLYTGHLTRMIGDLEQKPLDHIIKDFLNKHRPQDYDILLVSSLSATHDVALKFIRIFKKHNPAAFVIVGGIHATVAPDDTIMDNDVNAICIGEGEDALIELLSCLRDNKTYEHVCNFWFNKNGNLIKNHVRPYIYI